MCSSKYVIRNKKAGKLKWLVIENINENDIAPFKNQDRDISNQPELAEDSILAF